MRQAEDSATRQKNELTGLTDADCYTQQYKLISAYSTVYISKAKCVTTYLSTLTNCYYFLYMSYVYMLYN